MSFNWVGGSSDFQDDPIQGRLQKMLILSSELGVAFSEAFLELGVNGNIK